MNKKIDARDFEEIERLIRTEIGEALNVSRSPEREARLRKRIDLETKAARAKSTVERLVLPAAASLILAVFAVLVFVVILRPPAPAPVDSGLFAEVLGRFLSLSGPAARPPSGLGGEERMSEAGGGFERALALAERRKAEDERGTPVRPGKPAAPALSMKERMEILFKDKVIERALTALAAKSKEA
ncbi:MAG: hypothetical protein ACXW2R_07015 [Candidatus Aminicenantales bacterium]